MSQSGVLEQLQKLVKMKEKSSEVRILRISLSHERSCTRDFQNKSSSSLLPPFPRLKLSSTFLQQIRLLTFVDRRSIEIGWKLRRLISVLFSENTKEGGESKEDTV